VRTNVRTSLVVARLPRLPRCLADSPVITEKQSYSAERAQAALLKIKYFLGVKWLGGTFKKKFNLASNKE